MFIDWIWLYNLVGIKDFIFFISSPSLQETLFPVKIVFIAFAIFFFCAVAWFYVNSSFILFHFQPPAPAFPKESRELKKVTKTWKKIKERLESGVEADIKLAVIDADDFFYQYLQDIGYVGDTFEEIVASANAKKPFNSKEVLQGHAVRNSIVYEPDFALSLDRARQIVNAYETAMKR